MKESKDMRIGILSMQRIVNYGSVLQAYSLKNIIQELTDVPVRFIDIDRSNQCRSLKSIQESVDYETPAAFPPGILQKGKRRIISKLSAYNKVLIRRFMHDELKLDQKLENANTQCVVIGSDEVFNHSDGVCLQLHGDVKCAERVISYAASCGSARAEDILPQDRKIVKQAMMHIESVSVRDHATEKYVKAVSGQDCVHHLDPVLVGCLRNRKHHSVWLKNYMVVYAYGHRIRTDAEIQAIQQFAKKYKLKTVALGGSQFWCDLYIPVSPFRMLDYFANANCVVTDTFHGAIFSVINSKRFAVLPRQTNRAKISCLLEDLNLSDRVVSHMEELESVLTKEISYNEVDIILAQECVRTRTYLKEQLGV